MNAIGLCIQVVEGRIAKLQALRSSLLECVPLMADLPAEAAASVSAPAPKARTAAPKKRAATKKAAAAPAPAAPAPTGELLEKPQTIVGAMKQFIRAHAKFTREEIADWLKADGDFAKLLSQSSDSAIPGNLAYWTNQGYLDRAEDGYKVTGAGKEWFAK